MPDKSEDEAQEEFEQIVAAALKVDPTGISGKHRRSEDDDEQAVDGEPDGR